METVCCNLCGRDDTDLLYQIPDWQMGRKDIIVSYVRCRYCGLIYQNPRISDAEFDLLYPEQYECYQPEMNPRLLAPLLRLSAQYGMRKRSKLITRQQKSGRLLDVGCASGVFLKEMQSAGKWELYGIEPNRTASIAAQQQVEGKILNSTLEKANFPDNFFDVVTLWDVLEHLPDPLAGLGEVHRVLKPGGSLVLRVPNAFSWDAGWFRKYWAGFEPPRHYYVFQPSTLREMLEKSGFSVRHLGCDFGGYLTFLLSLRFFWSDQGAVPPVLRSALLRILQSAPARLLAAPLFWLLSRKLRGPLINVTAHKLLSLPSA